MATKTSKAEKAAQDDVVWRLIESERLALVNDLAGVTEDQLAGASGLVGWSSKELLGHIVLPFLVPTPRYVLSLMRNRGNIDKVNNGFAPKLAERSATELINTLRANADSRWSPPGEGPGLPLTEIAVHGQELRRALGISNTVAPAVVDAITANAEAKKDATAKTTAALIKRLAPC